MMTKEQIRIKYKILDIVTDEPLTTWRIADRIPEESRALVSQMVWRLVDRGILSWGEDCNMHRTKLPDWKEEEEELKMNIEGNWSEEIMNEECGTELFARVIDEASVEMHRRACEKGFWDGERNDGELIALMHSELSEALEALRQGNPPSEKIPEFSNLEEEMADILVRILDFAGARKLRLGEATIAKIKYNEGRVRKHGKEF